jgi:predicted dehydrogenase
MLRVSIIGCGKIADQHAEQIRWIPGCELVAVCDQEELMAKQLAERYGVRHCFTEVSDLLKKVRPDVVHVTTPAQSHFELGKKCLEAGCHVYMEKPFTLNAGEAEDLLELATKRNLNVTSGHNLQFNHPARHMRELINKGYLGGSPIHLESIYCYDLGDRSYTAALLGDKDHWVRGLPGNLAHNNISHGVCRIAEFLTGKRPRVIAQVFTSTFLKNLGEKEIFDEIRAIIIDDNETTAYFTFSSQIRPVAREFRIYGPQNSLVLDDDHQTLIKVKGAKYKSYLNHFIPPFTYASQYAGNGFSNMKKFIQRDFHMNSGMRYLFQSFYESVKRQGPLPIPYKEIILTARIMDDIFEQTKMNRTE